MSGSEELKSVLDQINDRLKALEGRPPAAGVPLARVEEVVQAAVKNAGPPASPDAKAALEAVGAQVSELSGKLAATEPVVSELGAKKQVIGQVCDAWPELCAFLEERKKAKEPGGGKPGEDTSPHDVILQALNETGIKVLGRAPTWADLLDLCPGGDCGQAAARAILKRPELLEKALADDQIAQALIEVLQKSGKLKVEPPPPEKEVVAGESQRSGWFGRIPTAAE